MLFSIFPCSTICVVYLKAVNLKLILHLSRVDVEAVEVIIASLLMLSYSRLKDSYLLALFQYEKLINISLKTDDLNDITKSEQQATTISI